MSKNAQKPVLLSGIQKEAPKELKFRLEVHFDDHYLLGRSSAYLKIFKVEIKRPNGKFEKLKEFSAPWSGEYEVSASKFYSDSHFSVFLNDQLLPDDHLVLQAFEKVNVRLRCDRETRISDNNVVDVMRSSFFEKDLARSIKDLYCLVTCNAEYPCFIHITGRM